MSRPRTPKRPPAPEPPGAALSIRCTAEELAAFHEAAAASGVNLATWVRVLLRRGAGLPTL